MSISSSLCETNGSRRAILSISSCVLPTCKQITAASNPHLHPTPPHPSRDSSIKSIRLKRRLSSETTRQYKVSLPRPRRDVRVKSDKRFSTNYTNCDSLSFVVLSSDETTLPSDRRSAVAEIDAERGRQTENMKNIIRR